LTGEKRVKSNNQLAETVEAYPAVAAVAMQLIYRRKQEEAMDAALTSITPLTKQHCSVAQQVVTSGHSK